MLKLIEIKKDYVVANNKVPALKGISISFRSNEFVSILGPSGCGKTTLLNIIGGLDHYTDGDLFIDNVSTKSFNDRDWDTYRNHRIGFIFQSYNLIPHQTVLENVELALTISGMGKEERIRKAKDALDKVGLSKEYHKKPNQLSGGQCQRVAIARALVNEPEILLADEPTGALDTKTSIQIMDLIKEISKERLVIMVTHNPEIAKEYSTRIVTLLDGLITSDSHPYDDNKQKEPVKLAAEKKSKLSFWSAFKLSARNLRSKFKRTLMTCIAGSIGIIGVASVLSVSTGVRTYIRDMQEDMLSGNPISVDEETMNLELLMESSSQGSQREAVKKSIKDGYINVDSMIENLISSVDGIESFRVKNDITDDYIQYLYDMPKEYYSAIATYYGIDVANNIYTNIPLQGTELNAIDNRTMSLSSIISMYTSMLKKTSLGEYSNYVATLSKSFNQAVNDNDFIATQYDIISDPQKSKLAEEEDEIMIVVSDDAALTDLLLAQLGYFSQREFFNIVYKASKNDKLYDSTFDKDKFSYDELLNKTFTYYPNNSIYTKVEEDSPLASFNPFLYNYQANDAMENGVDLKITAILKPKKDLSYGCLNSGIYYTPKFTQKYLADNYESEIATYLKGVENNSITSMTLSELPMGICYEYNFNYIESAEEVENPIKVINQTDMGYVGNANRFSALLGAMGASTSDMYVLTLRDVGGMLQPNNVNIYPSDFSHKNDVTRYLKQWNTKKDITLSTGKVLTAEERQEIIYTDTLSVMINMLNKMIDMVTIALVAFTALSLVVSTVMIAIITYVSVIERVKEIGVIRSLGGRKKDVSRLFTAETFIIGGISGCIGVGITYILSLIINLAAKSTGITVAKLPVLTAVIMISISILLTLISGLIPANIASKKDPVDALRTE